jgi:hypothetical protein
MPLMPMSAPTSSILPPDSVSCRSLTRTTRRPSVSTICLSRTSRASQISPEGALCFSNSSRVPRSATSRAAKVRTDDQGMTSSRRREITNPVTSG